MAEPEKVVVRFLDGALLKGSISDFSAASESLLLEDADEGRARQIPVAELKAIFFVKCFEGDSRYSEKKAYGIRKPRGHRAFVKFIDNEDMVGFLEGEPPWGKGFFLHPHRTGGLKGFFMLPADDKSNNLKLFVFAHAVKDVTVVP